MSKPEETETLESLLRARLADPRAMVGAVVINADRVFVMFGAIGDHRRLTLRVVGDEIALPEIFEAPAAADDNDEAAGNGDDVEDAPADAEPAPPDAEPAPPPKRRTKAKA